MVSFFARLRAQSLSAAPVPPVSDTPSQPIVKPAYTHQISRKIHPDPNALLATYSAEGQEHAQDEPDRGLRPSSRRWTVSGPTPKRSIAHTLGSDPAIDEVSEPAHSREPSPQGNASASDETDQSHWLHRFSQFALPSVWSTFGRGRQHSSPRIDQFDDRGSRPGSPKSSRLSPGPIDGPPSRRPSTKQPSTLSHESPSSESKRSSTNQSMLTTPVRSRPGSARTNVTVTAVAAYDLALEHSPRTFGHRTPEAPSSPLIGGSPPPPLPPLVHRGLQPREAEAPEEETEAMHDIPELEHDTGALYQTKDQSTYPRRRSRLRNEPSAFSSLPSVKPRSRRKSSTSPGPIPNVKQIFLEGPPQQSNAVIPTTTAATVTQDIESEMSSARTRTLSGTGRRSSAEWSAEQAVAQGADSWPAQVSRQILELSLGDAGGGPVATFPRPAVSEARVANEPGSSSRPSAFSFPLSSPSPSLSLSPSLGPPFLLQDPHTNLSGSFGQGRPKRSTGSSTRTQGGKTAALQGSLDDTMTGQKKKNDSTRSPTPPSRPSTATKSAEDSFTGPSSSSSLHQIPFQSFSLESSPDSGSESPPASRFPRRSVSDPERKSSKRRSMFSTPVKTSASEEGNNGASSKGKRKADDVEGTPPDQKKDTYHAKFALPTVPRPSRASANSASSTTAHSSYQRKRARLSTSTPFTSPPESRSGSSHREGIARGHGRGSSRTTLPEKDRPTSSRSQGLLPRQSLSQVSIPISALVSPHAPSLSLSGTFHMRDPRKPRRVMETGWALHLPVAGEPGSGSPVHAWLFFIGWVVFPLWWAAAFWRIPTTRRVGGVDDMEKGVMLDDPQVEFDARSWRNRCRIMSVISLLTYIPFIILVVVFVRKSH